MSTTRRIFPLKYASVRVCPSDGGSNSTEIKTHKKYKINTLEEFIDAELEEQGEVLKLMGCDPLLSEAALEAMRKAMESADTLDGPKK